ncbi:MAG: DUF559 domain-containing protein, partial [Synechococcaceae cyanobacterium SM2_3_2]|nr:DUF559 domain-containing protein [Synechococcaceae cyanobacterium SM2_3_2]
MTTPPRKPVFIEKIFPVTLLNQQVYYEHGGNPFKGLHRWYSRKPLSFSRASVLGSLLPADLTMEEFEYLLGMDPDGKTKLYKTPPGSVRIQKVHDLCEQMWGTRTPTVMDAFAGGGSIPFEAVRYGLRVLASDLNPVAVVTMKAAMEYPLKFGAQLQEDIDYWVKWVGDEAAKRLDPFFPSLPGETVQNYLWAHTVVCPSCESVVPLSPNWWLYKRPEKQNLHKWCAVKPIPNLAEKRVDFELVKGRKGKGSTIVTETGEDYDPDTTTTSSRGVGKCPNCGSVIEDDYIVKQGGEDGLGHQLYTVSFKRGQGNLEFRLPDQIDIEGINKSERYLPTKPDRYIPLEAVPFGHLSSERSSMIQKGLDQWHKLFNPRQLLTLVTYVGILNEAKEKLLAEMDPDRAAGILTYLAMVMDRCSDMNCRLAHWDSSRAGSKTASAQHSLNLMWNYPEVAGTGELWHWCADALASDYKTLCSLLGIDSSTLIPPAPLVKGGSELDTGVAPLIKSDSEAQAHSLLMDEAKVPTPPLSRGAGGDLQHLAKQRNLPYTPGHLPYNHKLVDRAKELRKNMTPPERKLWENYLKTFPDRVYRQRPIDHFIVDFYCPAKKLVIEIDGDPHFTEEGKLYDEERTQILEAYGLNVLRFTNLEVMDHFESVCSRIATFDPPQPPLTRGEQDNTLQ